MTNTMYEHAVAPNGTRYVRKRRRPDAFERVFAAVLTGALLVSMLLVVALGAGAVWLVVVVVQDLARRLGG